MEGDVGKRIQLRGDKLMDAEIIAVERLMRQQLVKDVSVSELFCIIE